MASTSSIGTSNSLYTTKASSRADRFVARNDQNGDGQISLGEFQSIGQNLPGTATGAATATASTADTSGRAALFGRIDANGDGALSPSELSTYQQQQVATAKGALLDLQEVFGGDQSGQGGTGAVKHAHRGHRQVTDPAATDTTAQADGTDPLSDGLAAAKKALFGAVDTDGDGAISKGELSSFLTQALARYGATASAGTATAKAAATAASV